MMKMTTTLSNGKKIKISLPSGCNQNFLVWGDSGMGKSYCDSRLVETMVADGRHVWCIDFSGSYAEKQLHVNKLSIENDACVFDLSSENMTWDCRYEDANIFCSDVADVLIEALCIRGRFQKKVLRKYYKKFAGKKNMITISEFQIYLENEYQNLKQDKKGGEDVVSLKQIIELLSGYEHLSHFQIATGKNEVNHEKRESITLIQLSDLPDQEKEFLTTMIIGLLWKEIKISEERRRCDVLLIDEFQHIFRHGSGSLKQMFCQGRKNHFNVILSTQYLTQYNEEDLNCFGQNGGFIILRPSDMDLEFSTKMICDKGTGENFSKWYEKLKELEVGDAVYCGKYLIEGRKQIYKQPIVCHIENDVKCQKT